MFDYSVKEDSQEQVFGSCIAKTRKGKKDVQFVLKRQPCMSKYLSSRFNAICTPVYVSMSLDPILHTHTQKSTIGAEVCMHNNY